jgi:hypothetical protein
MNENNGSVKELMFNDGYVYPTMMGLQPDLNSAWFKDKVGDTEQWREASFCDHDCVRATDPNPGPKEANGGYDCFAAKSRNRGIIPTTMAGYEKLARWIEICMDGQRYARDDFMEQDFGRYCNDREIPPAVAAVLEDAIFSDRHELNEFGGNPELNDACLDLIPHFRSKDVVISLTTTGGRPKRDARFREKLMANPPDRIAVSADDLSPEEVERYVGMSLSELETAHAEIPTTRGQDRKAVEGIWIGKFAEANPGFPPVLYNTVIHERNIHAATEMIEALRTNLPHAIINPYIGQSSMYNAPPLFGPEHFPAVRKVIHNAMRDTVAGRQIPKRLPFYFVSEAAFRRYEHEPAKLSRALAGYDLWRCYRENACWYLQFGRNEAPLMQIQGLIRHKTGAPGYDPGGHLGCTWNAFTVTEMEQIQDAQQVRRFLRGGMSRIAASANGNKCLGCTMPRLMFHQVSIELGLDPELWPTYREVRREYSPHLFS